MTWLGDILKQLELSKKFTGAIFLCSSTLLVAPYLASGFVDPVPTTWRWVVFGACIFSGALLTFWVVPPAIGSLGSLYQRMQRSHRFNPLSEQELGFLIFLAENYPNDTVNLATMRFESLDRLTAIEISARLRERGLVSVYQYNDDLVTITRAGRTLVLSFRASERVGPNNSLKRTDQSLRD